MRPFRRRGALALGAAGAGAAVATGARPARVAGAAPDAQAQAQTQAQAPPVGRFGRLFRLPPFATPSQALTAALLDLGRQGGPLDARDALDRGPIALIVDPALSQNNRDNPALTAGVTFVGQFVDHDLSFDRSSRLGQPAAPEATENARTAAFDLDSVYGPGLLGDPQLFDQSDPAKFRVGSGGRFEDVPRRSDNQAILADPRNDEHLILSGLHAAFLLFHNRAVDRVRALAGGRLNDPRAALVAARLLTVWHYQWIVLHEFLPQVVGRAVVDDVLARRGRIFAPKRGEGFIPVEFQTGAYRMGHSMVRPSYRANLKGNPNGQPFFGFIFDPSQDGKADPDDLRGGCRAPRRFVGWQTFFDFGDGLVRPNKRIDTRLSTPLFRLPTGAITGGDPPASLAQRNLLRHLTWELPSGQRIAQELGVAPLTAADLRELRQYGVGLETSTPLWYYVLKEAALVADGLRLGPVGGRLVAEVFVGLLEADPTSFLAAAPGWRPDLPARAGGGDFRMVDFLTFAGVDPAARGQ